MALKNFYFLLLVVFLQLIQSECFAEPPSISSFQSKIDGPNCHNTGLVFNRLISVRRHVPRQEMQFWLKRFCKELPRGSSIAQGDLRIWRRVQKTEEPMLWHTQIIINQEMVFEKLGFSASHPYRLDTYKPQGRSSAGGATWSDAKRTPSCSWANGIPNDCYLYVTYYRCDQQSYNNLLNQHRDSMDALFGSDFLAKLTQIEESTDHFADNYFDTQRAKEILESATFLRSRLDHIQKNSIDPILLLSLKWRLDGIILQMQMEPVEFYREPPPLEL